MSKYNEQHATTMLNALIGTDTLAEHDKEIVMNTIDECIKDLKGSYPLIDNRDLQHGFCCAIQRLEQIKEEKGEQTNG